MTQLERMKLSDEQKEQDVKAVSISHDQGEPITVHSIGQDLRKAWEWGRLYGRREMAREMGNPVPETGDGECSVCHVWPCGYDRP